MGKKIYIKESEIKQYVRQLLREYAKDSEVEKNLALMLAGQQYDRSFFNSRARRQEAEFRTQRGLGPLRKPSGGVVPRIIGPDGNDLTPENDPQACAKRLKQKEGEHNAKRRKKYVKKGDIQNWGEQNGMSAEEIDALKKQNKVHDDSALNPDESEFGKRWLAMSPEEREAEAARIRDERKAKQREANKAISDELSKSSRRTLNLPSKDDLIQRIQNLKQKQEEMGPRTDLNSYRWDDLQRCIKDAQNILRRYHNNDEIGTFRKDANDDEVENAVQRAMDDIKNNPQFRELAKERGDAYIDDENFPLHNEKDNGYEEQMDDDDRRNRKGHRMRDAERMGLFGNDDDAFPNLNSFML